MNKQRQMALMLTFLCMITAGSSVFAQEEVIKIDTALVNLNVVVKDRQGRRVRGLTREDFDVYEDGVRQEITHFFAEKRALRLVLLFDVSVSMETVLPTIKQEAIALLNTLHADDKMNIVSFASDVQKPSGWLRREQAADVIRNVVSEPHPQPVPASIGQHGYRIGDTNTYLYEAFRYVFNSFKANNDRIAVVMFSDGVDTAAGRSNPNIRQRANEIGREMVRQAQESWALIYPIRYKTEQAIGDLPASAQRPFPPIIRTGSSPNDSGRDLFEKIAAASGGEVFEWTTPQDLTAAITNALDDLRSQYGIAYKPAGPNGERRVRRIQVRIKRPNLVVRTREVYFR
jgi:Ca-activated chloride channel family protein